MQTQSKDFGVNSLRSFSILGSLPHSVQSASCGGGPYFLGVTNA